MKFMSKGMLQVSMVMYLKNVIAGFSEVITGKATMLAADYLFTIIDKKETRLLDKERVIVFHDTVAQLLFMST